MRALRSVRRTEAQGRYGCGGLCRMDDVGGECLRSAMENDRKSLVVAIFRSDQCVRTCRRNRPWATDSQAPLTSLAARTSNSRVSHTLSTDCVALSSHTRNVRGRLQERTMSENIE